MSSTILTNKLAAAFRHPVSGRVIYALFMESYGSNVSPKEPSWYCLAMGEYADVMRNVFHQACYCEGGMMRSRSGAIKPENFIESFKRKMASPFVIGDLDVVFHVGSEEQGKQVRHSLSGAGIAEEKIATLSSVGNHPLRLFADVDAVLALYGRGGLYSASRFLLANALQGMSQDVSLSPLSNGDFGINLVAEAENKVTAYRLEGEYLLVKIGDGPYHNAGWAYRALQEYIRTVAYAAEMRSAGSARQKIGGCRLACRFPSDLPFGVKVRVQRQYTDDYYVQIADRLMSKCGAWTQKDLPPPAVFEVFFHTLDEASRYDLLSLTVAQLEWIMPTTGVQQFGKACFF